MTTPQLPRAERRLRTLGLAALGVVYGDIGTSPLYALRECFSGSYAIPPARENVVGVLSLIFWSLIVIISIKYLVFVMRADNRGEGGILALLALIRPSPGSKDRQFFLTALGLFGAALLYGDGMITPAISVLSALEGLQVATPFFKPYVIPITVAVLTGLFLVQHRGTTRVGAIFGPITLLWFVTIGVLGLLQILRDPRVLAAVNPVYSIQFFGRTGYQGFLVLGAVFLVVTGGEALYADMGHFGKAPIRLAWFTVVLPALLLNYFGQGALLLESPGAAAHPFYHLAPAWLLYPLVLLATAATIIASQAVISGAFSLTRQAVQLGYSPRVEIRHTSPQERGQIYIPQVNWALLAATIGLVLGFRSSSHLAAAYGVAVTTTMVVTTLLAFVVARRLWRWRLSLAGTVTVFFLIFDLAFFGANMLKIRHGGWFPLAVGALIYMLMATWHTGRAILGERLQEKALSFEQFLQHIAAHPPIRVPGTAVFLTATPTGVPPALLHNLRHNKVLHEKVILLTVLMGETPRAAGEQRREFKRLDGGFFRVLASYGFMEEPDIPAVLEELKSPELDIAPGEVTYFLGRETLIVTPRPGMAIWREKVFVLMARNALRATAFFKLPPDRVVELGVQVEM